jgi:hypothetical protein
VPLVAGATCCWELSVSANDVIFLVEFAPGSKLIGPRMMVKDYGKVATKDTTVVAGEFTAPFDGVICVTFDNKYSWIKRKTVQFASRIITATGAINEAVGDTEEVDGAAGCASPPGAKDEPL